MKALDSFNLQVGHKVTLKARFTIGGPPPKGMPAATVGMPHWTMDTLDVVSLVPSKDGKTCVIKGLNIGSVIITVKGQGHTEIADDIKINVTPVLADTITILPGVEEQ